MFWGIYSITISFVPGSSSNLDLPEAYMTGKVTVDVLFSHCCEFKSSLLSLFG